MGARLRGLRVIVPVPGIPAEFHDFVVERRCALLKTCPGFTGLGLTLLDFGCGNGAAMILLGEYFRSCHGIDRSAEYKAAFEVQAQRRGVTNCTFSNEDLCTLDTNGRSFDRIICFEVLEHVHEELAAAQALRRLLAPGGKAAITVPNKWWIFETHGAYLPLLPWHRVPFFSWLPPAIHARYAKARIYTKGRLARLLASAGFNVTEIFYMTAPMDRVRWKPLQNLLRRTVFGRHRASVPFLATSIVAFVEPGGLPT